MLKHFKMVRWMVIVIGIIGWFKCEFECAPTFQILQAPVSVNDKNPGYANITTGCHVCHVYSIFSNPKSTCFVVNCSRVDANLFSESDVTTKSPRFYWLTTPSTTLKYNPIIRNEESPLSKFIENTSDENFIDQPMYIQDASQPPSYQNRLGNNQTVETYQNTRTTNKTQEIYYQNIHAVNQNVETYQNTHTINQTQETYQNARDINRKQETRDSSISDKTFSFFNNKIYQNTRDNQNQETRDSGTNDKDTIFFLFNNENNDFTVTTPVYQLFVEDTNNTGLLPFILSKLITTTTINQPSELQPSNNSNKEAIHRPNNQVFWSRHQTTTPSLDEYNQFMEMLEEDLQEYEVKAILDGNSFKYSNDSIYEYNTINA